MTSAHISIAVYQGQPIDWQKFRHASLFIQFQDGSPSLLAHIVGPTGGYEFEARSDGYDPSRSDRLAKLIDVGLLGGQTSSEQLKATLATVPIDNRDREFNCQTWIENVLKRWKDRGLLTEQSYERGLDGMVDAIAEAKDEED